MRRREVLKGLTVGLGLAPPLVFAAAVSNGASPKMPGVDLQLHIRRALGAIFSEDSILPTIGRRYLSLYPEEAEIDRLWTKLGRCSASSREDWLQVNLAKLRQRDFESGDIVVIEGWILARTEAQACALATLV